MTTPSPRPGFGRRLLRTLFLVAGLAVVAFLALIAGAYVGITRSLPPLDLEAYAAETPQVTKIFDASASPVLLAELRGLDKRTALTGDQIPQVMRDAVVAIEDENFYAHSGVSVFSILRSAWAALRGTRVEYASSTITQRLVKNAFISTSSAADPELAETAFAYQLEGKWSKEKILNEFLNVAYFGEGAYGLAAAARTYFGVEAEELDLAQAALLAGLLGAPSAHSPFRDPEAALARRDLVLNKMYQQRYVTSSELQKALAQPLRLVASRPTADSNRVNDAAPSPWVELIREQLVARYGASAALRGGLRVYTSLIVDLQEAAEKAITTVLDRPGGPCAALLSLNLDTGGIVALAGFGDSSAWKLDGSGPAGTELGGAVLPFVLVTALEQGLSPDTVLEPQPGPQAQPVASEPSPPEEPLTLAAAVASASVSALTSVIEQVGPAAVAKTTRAIGLSALSGSETPSALAQGRTTGPVNFMELALAYAAIATDGESLEASLTFDPSRGDLPMSIVRVVDHAGALIDQNEASRAHVLDPGLAEIVAALLEQELASGAARAAALGRPAAAQAGTSADEGDAWFIGWTPQLLTVVWVGYGEERRPLVDVYDTGVTGVELAAQIWNLFMTEALSEVPPTSFSKSYLQRYVTLEVCEESGLLPAQFCPSTMKRLFRADNIPVEVCPLHSPKEVPVPRVVGLPVQKAVEVLAAARFLTSQVLDRSSLQPTGTVVSQRPSAGSLLLEGSTVVLVVSTGENRAAVPDVRGLPLEEALAKLSAAGLRGASTYVTDPAPAGVVLSQDPLPGKIVARGSLVTLTVSSGPAETPPTS